MYTVNGEKYEKHRALHLVNVTHHLSGSYMCKVNIFLNKIINTSIFIWRVFISIIRKEAKQNFTLSQGYTMLFKKSFKNMYLGPTISSQKVANVIDFCKEGDFDIFAIVRTRIEDYLLVRWLTQNIV